MNVQAITYDRFQCICKNVVIERHPFCEGTIYMKRHQNNENGNWENEGPPPLFMESPSSAAHHQKTENRLQQNILYCETVAKLKHDCRHISVG